MARSLIGWLAIAACAALVGCVPSLAAVRTTAGLGTQLASYQDAFDLSATYCRYTDYVTGADPRCEALQADLDNWHAVNRALVGYATALAAMADDSTDRNEQDHIATALGATSRLGKPWSDALNDNVTSGVSRGVSALIAGIVGVYRRERLAATIRDADEPLQAVARGIDQNIELLDRADQNLIAMITDTMSSVKIGNSPAADRAGITIALSSVRNELHAHRGYLASYKAAIAAFAKAHSHVRKKLSGLGDKKADLELLRLIATDVTAIVRGAHTALTPLPPPPSQ